MSHRKIKLPSPPARAHVYLLYIWGCERAKEHKVFFFTWSRLCFLSGSQWKNISGAWSKCVRFHNSNPAIDFLQTSAVQFRFEAEERLVSENRAVEASPGWKNQHQSVHGTREVQKTNKLISTCQSVNWNNRRKEKNCTMIKKKQPKKMNST